MTIQELEDKHAELDYRSDHFIKHRKLSIQFAIEMLEEGRNWFELKGFIDNKIEELKKYL